VTLMLSCVGLIRLLGCLLSDKPNTTHGSYSARLQVLNVTGDSYVLVFDQWQGLRNTVDIESMKKQTGARGVLFFEGTIEID
jgi:hypothetical protein